MSVSTMAGRRCDFSSVRSKLFDALGHQLAWWCTVLVARQGLGSWGALAVIAYTGVHLWLGRSRHVATMALAAALVGLAGDTLLLHAGVLVFSGQDQALHSPLWMVALWAALGVNLTASLRSFGELRALLAVALGAVAGPLAYLGGASLGMLDLIGPWALPAVGVEWALASALLLVVQRVSRPDPQSPAIARSLDRGAK